MIDDKFKNRLFPFSYSRAVLNKRNTTKFMYFYIYILFFSLFDIVELFLYNLVSIDVVFRSGFNSVLK